MLKIIPITEPGVASYSFKVVRTDADEAEVRSEAAAQGLLAGQAMPIPPNPQFWAFVDYLKGR